MKFVESKHLFIKIIIVTFPNMRQSCLIWWYSTNAFTIREISGTGLSASWRAWRGHGQSIGQDAYAMAPGCLKSWWLMDVDGWIFLVRAMLEPCYSTRDWSSTWSKNDSPFWDDELLKPWSNKVMCENLWGDCMMEHASYSHIVITASLHAGWCFDFWNLGWFGFFWWDPLAS